MNYFFKILAAVTILTFLAACNEDPFNLPEKKGSTTLREYKIIYSTYENSVHNVYLSDFRSKNNVLWSDSATVRYSPYNSQIYLRRYSADKKHETYLYDFVEHKQLQRVLRDKSEVLWVSHIPHKNKILILEAFDQLGKLYLADTDGIYRELIADKCNESFISPSPDGSKILLVYDKYWSILNIDGSNLQLLFPAEEANSVHWHNDSKNLIIAKQTDQNRSSIELFNTANQTNTVLRNIDDDIILNAKISTDDKKIAFFTSDLDLYVLDIESSNLSLIKDNPNNFLEYPELPILEWAPNDKFILCSKFNNSVTGNAKYTGLELINLISNKATSILEDDIALTAYWIKVK